MLFDPKDGLVETEKVVTYHDVLIYCQSPMGSISILDLRVTGEHRLEGGPEPDAAHYEALMNLKDSACDLVEHIGRESGCQPIKMDEQLLEAPLTGAAKGLYDRMIAFQHDLQRLIGQPEGPVPVCI